MCYVVCSSVSLLSYVCSLSVGDGEGEEKSSGEIRGQRPHGRKRPPHASWGLAPFLFDISVCENSCTDCYGSSDSGLARFPAKSVHNETESK